MLGLPDGTKKGRLAITAGGLFASFTLRA